MPAKDAEAVSSIAKDVTEFLAELELPKCKTQDLKVAYHAALMEQFWDQPFERGNLDAGRLSWLFEREVKAYDDPFDPASYEAQLILDLPLIQSTFPEAFDRD